MLADMSLWGYSKSMTSYRVHGITDETDTCEVCGKVELRRVVMLAVLDADGNTEEIIYAGTSCTARKLAQTGTHTTAVRVRDAAAAAARVLDQAREFADDMASCTLNMYVAANRVALLNANNNDTTAALAAAKRQYAELQDEIKAIRAGDLSATRFARKLPTL